MSMNPNALTKSAVTVPITIIENGKEVNKDFLFSPLSDKEFTELDTWVRGQYISAVRASCENMPEAEASAEMMLARVEALNVSTLSAVGQSLLATLPGLTRVLWYSLRKCHPEYGSIEALSEFTFDAGGLLQIMQAFKEANSPINPTAPRKTGTLKKGAHRKNRRKKSKST